MRNVIIALFAISCNLVFEGHAMDSVKEVEQAQAPFVGLTVAVVCMRIQFVPSFSPFSSFGLLVGA